MNQKEENLISSERGAIMVIGLIMALSLIGTLWFLLGIGATIAFRERMQDAADAAAFSQAACNARAMNAIVMLNIIILVCVAIYLLASIALSVAYAVCATETAACADLLGGEAACLESFPCWEKYWGVPFEPIGLGTFIGAGGLAKKRDQFAQILYDAEVIANFLANGIALLGPDAGTAASVDAASDYKSTGPDGKMVIGVALAETNLPGGGFLQLNQKKIGLPVENEALYRDCEHLGQLLEGAVLGSLGSSKGAKKVLGFINGAYTVYYCREKGGIGGAADSVLTALKRFTLGGGDDGDYWFKKGPIRQWKHDDSGGGSHANEEKNSADIYQSWALSATPEGFLDNDAEHKINLAQQKYQAVGTPIKPTTIFYYSEAEYYFDCADTWSSAACNDNGSLTDMDMTLYSLNWRARLVRTHPPKQIAGIMNAIGDVLNIFTSIRSFENDHADEDAWIQALFGAGVFQEFAGILQSIPANNHH